MCQKGSTPVKQHIMNNIGSEAVPSTGSHSVLHASGPQASKVVTIVNFTVIVRVSVTANSERQKGVRLVHKLNGTPFVSASNYESSLRNTILMAPDKKEIQD